MDTSHVFSSKAERYAKYRWRYASQSIQTIFEVTRITKESRVADIGAGTGILTKDFAGKVRQIVAVEPNAEMRRIARRELEQHPDIQVIAGRAEATALVGHQIDLITVAQALHWFEPEAARKEFLRIVKPGGWLAILRNYGTDHELNEALEKAYPAENDTVALMIGQSQPSSFYYGAGKYQKEDFPFTLHAAWEEFIGALSTASSAPDEGSPLYGDFERSARRVFDDFSVDQLIELHGMTELFLGQIKGG
ncbi:MAG TPA: class I SAM-dependent methyltransferase [Anaerolineales bacterium]|nr:class I SAM-dependent methyltransferase [Anaerolineales bacterium]